MRIIIDLDGTICDLRKPNQSYADVKPKKNVREILTRFVDRGDKIIIFTARHMKTCNGDVELVRHRMEELTIDWLGKHQIPYHELIFGKPFGDVYIDDLAIQFNNWDEVASKLDIKSKRKDNGS